MGGCLSPAEIERFLADTLSPEDKVRAQAHLAACKKCSEQVERGLADKELLGQIKRAYGTETIAPPDERPSGRPPPDLPMDAIEGYEILNEIHRGGQGVVYKAVQKATKRTVALKVLLQGPYASRAQQRRFEREIDLVASLQHPNIVTLYDSGVTGDGRHYFAMEYIRGLSLDAYLSDKDLNVDETLRLFQRICTAVNYAHQRGVIHRDLKPSNIRIDAEGEPHILDFGLAKAAGASLTQGVSVTGEFMGTLAYASPEQTKGDPNLIDIRTDIYSLGVIIYEMLTHKYPYPVLGQMAEVLTNIAEAEPKKPSTIRRQINDEVETIVLQALAKEKDRRYQSAENLARDIEHYLNGEPIDAKRDSTWYVIRKSLRRYRVPVAVAAAFVILLGGSTIVLWTMNQNLISERQRAEAARDAEAEQLGRAEQALAERAEAEAARDWAEEKLRIMIPRFPEQAPPSDGVAQEAALHEALHRRTALQALVEEGEREIERLRSELSITPNMLSKLRERLDHLRAKDTETVASVREIEAQCTKLAGDLAAAKAAAQDLAMQLVEAGNTARVGFIGERRGKAAILVECAGDRIVVGRKKPGSSQTEVLKRFTGSKPAREFHTWAGARDRQTELFMLLVRPEGIGHYELLLPWLEKERFEVGWEPWAVTKGALFPEP